jgi:CheY-like chemotaxis protein
VRHLVEMHGGRVSARSEGPGKGSEFAICLPTVQRKPIATATTSATVAQAHSNNHRRILVVEDNADALESLGLLLEIEGHEVRKAQDGVSALTIAEEFHPEAVLLDIGLPHMDGFEVIQHLRAQTHTHQVVVVALTGYGQAEDRRRTAEAGFDHHLIKPVDPKEVMAIVASLKSAT